MRKLLIVTAFVVLDVLLVFYGHSEAQNQKFNVYAQLYNCTYSADGKKKRFVGCGPTAENVEFRAKFTVCVWPISNIRGCADSVSCTEPLVFRSCIYRGWGDPRIYRLP